MGLLRTVSLIEGASLLLLVGIAMPLKYVAGWPQAVQVVGPIHGGLFVGLVLMLAVAFLRGQIPLKLAVLVGLASVVPFGMLWADRRLREEA